MKKNCALVDKISDLPDSIWGLILSHLPTKEAVATSILSKRWRFGWVTIHNLDFSCNNHDELANTKFVRFVNRVLLRHDAEFLYKFCLEWKSDCVSSTQVKSWISKVIDKHVNELSLCLGSRKSDMPVAVSCFDCASLQSLKLDGFIFVSAAAVFCLPKLKSLHLVEVEFESEETFVRLINGCSALDDLCIHEEDTDEDGDFTYRIFSTSLRRLTYTSACELKLKASSLEYLKLSGYMYGISVLKSLSSLVEADIRIEHGECISIVEVVRASNCAKFLTLLDNVMQALRRATISLSTEFRRLVKLETKIDCCPWSSLRDFIQNAENLENLTIWQDLYGEGTHGRHSGWTTPVEVPRCFSNSLKKVYIDGYKGMEDEHGMILYMLEHGSVLEVMMVTCCESVGDGGRLFELLQMIRESPRKSSVCEVEIIIV